MNGIQIAQTVDLGAVPLNWTIAGIGDFDGNGSMDFLWRDTSGNVQIWLMNGTQVLSTTVLGNVPTSWSVAETGDFNGDGKSDILWLENFGDVGVWFMSGVTVSSTTISATLVLPGVSNRSTPIDAIRAYLRAIQHIP